MRNVLTCKHIITLTVILICLASQDLLAQRIIRDLESNADLANIPNDSIERGKKPKEVPVDVVAWTIDPIFGRREPVDVDTLQHDFQNKAYPEGLHGEYNSLGNIGSPRESRIFMERPFRHDFPFITNMDQFIESPEDYKYYNTKSPYVNLSYDWCGTKTTGYDNFKGIYTNNAGKRFNFGGIFHYMYGQGYYDNQHTAFMNGTGWASYVNDHYDLHLHYSHYDMKLEENGGIADDNYITNPESMSRRFSHDDIPTRLNSTFSRQNHDVFTLNHRYHLGFTRVEEIDSVTTKEYFVPVTSIFHQAEIGNYRRRMISYDNWEDFYSYSFLPNDSTLDRYKLFNMYNRVGLTLHEGFNKYAVAGLSAYVGFAHRNYEIPDTLEGAAVHTPTKLKMKENDVLIGGKLERTQGTYIHYNADAEFVVAGTNIGDFEANGHGELNVPILADTAQLAIDAHISSYRPNMLFYTFHSKNYWWDQDLSKENRLRLMGTLSYTKTDTELTFGMENVSNYTYLLNNGFLAVNSSNEEFYTHNAEVHQKSSVQVLMARLNQQLKFGPAHLDADIVWQQSTDKDVLPLPTLSVYANLYFKFVLAKVLKVELGADMKYFTKYEAPDYDPVTAQFMLQNENTREKIGGYPLFTVYANLALKKLRFHISYYHLNQSDGRYFTMPHYPMNPKGLRFGISWNFYD
jgi:hypothetical protein